jgi:hypothetical protein
MDDRAMVTVALSGETGRKPSTQPGGEPFAASRAVHARSCLAPPGARESNPMFRITQIVTAPFRLVGRTLLRIGGQTRRGRARRANR